LSIHTSLDVMASTRGGLTTQAPQAVAWAGSPAAMEGKARAQCTEASSTWHEHRRGDHTVYSPRLSSVPGSATGFYYAIRMFSMVSSVAVICSLDDTHHVVSYKPCKLVRIFHWYDLVS
jgi:hypothetical protein